VAEHAGPVWLASLLGLPASTIGAVIAGAGLPRLAKADRLTGELLRGRRHSDRYEHPHAGDLLHVDVKKLGRMPDGGGWRVHGRREEVRGRGIGWDYVHVAVNDHTRLDTPKSCPTRRQPPGPPSCAARWPGWPATASSCAGRSPTTPRELPDRRRLDHRLHRTGHRPPVHPARPALDQRKAERFNRTLQTEWAYARRPWTSNATRTAALDSWLAHYNLARLLQHCLSHSALGGHPPISRLTA
jgi:hypothetical protein